MYEILGQTAVLILCGVFWRVVKPLGLEVSAVRQALSSVVYVLLLPALVLVVMWQAPLDHNTLRIALSAAGGVVFGLGSAWL